jgi:outer membrane receptor protein involved in Fe transport
VFFAGNNSPPPFDALFNRAKSYSYDDSEVFALPKAGLRYHLSQTDTISVTARKGYNPGGAYVNLQDATLSFPFETFESEKVWTYEAAYRTAMLNDRLQLGVTVFFNDYENKQFAIANPTNAPPRIFNEPDAESYGVEVEGKFAVTPAVDLTGGFGILHTRINKVNASTQRQIIGNDFGQDPSYSVSLEGAWRPVDSLELYAKGTYVDDYFTDFRNDSLNVAGGYTLVDVGASYRFGNATARVFVNNVTDEVAYSTLILNANPANAFLLDPRTYGASLDLKF